jgi:hypothetical protein
MALRAAEPSLSLESMEKSNALVFEPATAQDMSDTLRKVWLETPLEPQGA